MITEINTAAKLASHLTKLRDAAVRLGFSPLVTGALSLSADTAAKEARQAACAHLERDELLHASNAVRASVEICRDCRKALLIEDL